MSESEKRLPDNAAAVLPEEILRQRAMGWPDFHPEDFCHRCGRRNAVWWVGGDLWKAAVEGRERGVVDILCPSCFTELFEARSGTRCVWQLRLETQRPIREGK